MVFFLLHTTFNLVLIFSTKFSTAVERNRPKPKTNLWKPVFLEFFGRPLVERTFLREKRLSDAHGRGLCEANAGHAPRGMVCWGRDIVTWRRPGEIGALAQALLVEKGASNLYSNFLRAIGCHFAFSNPAAGYRWTCTPVQLYPWCDATSIRFRSSPLLLSGHPCIHDACDLPRRFYITAVVTTRAGVVVRDKTTAPDSSTKI
jgi:hypothetical protein